MKNRMFLLLLFIFFNALIHSEGFFYIDDTNVRIREFPNTESRIMGLLNQGDKVEILKSNSFMNTVSVYRGIWCKIKSNNKIGWILNNFIEYNLGFDNTTMIFEIGKVENKNGFQGHLLCYIENGRIVGRNEESSFYEKKQYFSDSLNKCYLLTNENKKIDLTLQRINGNYFETIEKVNCNGGLLILGDPLDSAKIIYVNERSDKEKVSNISRVYYHSKLSTLLYDKTEEMVDYNEIFLKQRFYKEDSIVYQGREYVFFAFLKQFPYNNKNEAFNYRSFAIIENGIVYPSFEEITFDSHYNPDKSSSGGIWIDLVTDINNEGYPEIFAKLPGYEGYNSFVFLGDKRYLHEVFLESY